MLNRSRWLTGSEYARRFGFIRKSLTMRTLWYISIIFIVLGIVLVTAGLLMLLVAASPISWLPNVDEARTLLGIFLTAQAAIAALTLAVTLFVMQGVNARRDVDERVYQEYIRRSWVRWIFWGSLLAVATTSVILVSQLFLSSDGEIAYATPGLRNLIPLAALAFLVNLLLAGSLFEKAVHLSRPEQWRKLRQRVNERDVHTAVQAFLGRLRRAVAAREASEADSSTLFPDPDEGSADEAIRALLGDARRAMSERRQQELRRSLDSVVDLVNYAMDQMTRTSIGWSVPGRQPEWPPLRELSRNLYSFREDVIREGDRDYMSELLRFDYRLTTQGMHERCGELFTVGLAGYRWNYQIASRIGGEFRDMLRDRFSQVADGLIFGSAPGEAFPYAMQMIRHQERVLSEAMHIDNPRDYHKLHRGFENVLRIIRLHWRTDDWPPSEASTLYEELAQEYQIALMGLGGRAILLAQSNRIADANPYLDVARGAYARLEPLANDLAKALTHDNDRGFSQWDEWETENAQPYQTIGIVLERYPLMFFTLRLVELSSETMESFDLHGRAQRALDWFIDNSEQVGDYVRAEIDPTLDQRLKFAKEALSSAIRRDKIAEDYEIIGRVLSVDRVIAFTSDVYAAAFTSNSLERLFEEAGAFLYLAIGAESVPRERGSHELLPKGSLTDTPENALMGYGRPDATSWGRALANDVLSQFCEALEGSPNVEAAIDAPAALLLAIDQAIEELNPEGRVALVLAGNWFRLVIGLNMENLEGYEPSSRLSESEYLGETGRYRGHPILIAPDHEGRRLYVVDIAGWGCFVRVQNERAQDLLIDIKPIPIDRARELLEANSDAFADQTDEESKLRKLQTYVEIAIGARTEFRVTDPFRARVVVPLDQEEDAPSSSDPERDISESEC